MKSIAIYSLVVIAAAICGLIPGMAVETYGAESNPEAEPCVTVEIARPDLFMSEYWNISFSSSVWCFTARLPVDEKLHWLMEAGFVLFDRDYTDPYNFHAEDQNVFMNPFLGVEFLDLNRRWFVQAGLRLPIISEESPMGKQYGMMADVDRMEAFTDDLIPVRLRLGNRLRDGSVTLHTYFGPSIWFFTGSETDADTEIWLDYGGHIWVSSELARIAGGFVGRYWLTADEGSFNERTLHQFDFTANFGRGRVRPGFRLKVPLDDDWESIGLKYVWGLHLTVLTH